MYFSRIVTVYVFFFLLVCHVIQGDKIPDSPNWRNSVLEDLKASINIRHNKKIAKNVIIFIGDGIRPKMETQARIFNEGEDGYLIWEKFPHIALLKTYSTDRGIPDSSSTATSMFTGTKVNYGTVGVNEKVGLEDCEESLLNENKLVTIATLAQEEGKATGFVTTGHVTDAVVSSLYAHCPNKEWECDSEIPHYYSRCKDIARQLIEDEPGRNFNVIMGGGRQQLKTKIVTTIIDPVYDKSCKRSDGRDLIAEWIRGKESQGVKYALPKNKSELTDIDTKDTDYLLGIFHNGHLPFVHLRDKSLKGVPSLQHMTTTAIKVLSNNKRGFLLLVENSFAKEDNVDSTDQELFDQVTELSTAVNKTLELLTSAGIIDETLVLVTSDISYNQTKIVESTTIKRETDVFVYAKGPYSYLFHNVHEQNYVAEVIKFASRIGYHHLHGAKHSGSSQMSPLIILTFILQLITLLIYK